MFIKKKSFIYYIISVIFLSTMNYTQANNSIKIAVVGPVTGSLAQYGDMAFAGAKEAVKAINQSGGINKQYVELVVFDDSCDPKQAVAVANKIVNEEISFVVGHICSAATQVASNIYDDESILMITPSSTSPAITDHGYKMVFRTIGLDNLQGNVAANYIANKIKPKRLAIIHDRQQYGKGLASVVKQQLEKKGVNIAMFQGITVGDKDFSALIARMKKEKIDFIYYGGYHPEFGLIIRQSNEKNFYAKFMGPEGTSNKAIIDIAGSAIKNVLVTLPKNFNATLSNKHIINNIKQDNPSAIGPFTLTSYAAINILAQAMKKSKDHSPEVIAQIIHNNQFATPIGNISFNKKGDLKNPAFTVYQFDEQGNKTSIK